MDSYTLLQLLKTHKAELQNQFGVLDIALFGSAARNETKPGSDIDILVELNEPSYTKYTALKIYLEQLFHQRVDLLRKGPHLSTAFLSSLQKELIHA
ncbi:MAG: nucleotidyltransferase domain-containing protein [Bacteroidia bacterium]|nr:nucleotidyltransferase domain-containing protein [Bacteroidia bacterium]